MFCQQYVATGVTNSMSIVLPVVKMKVSFHKFLRGFQLCFLCTSKNFRLNPAIGVASTPNPVGGSGPQTLSAASRLLPVLAATSRLLPVYSNSAPPPKNSWLLPWKDYCNLGKSHLTTVFSSISTTVCFIKHDGGYAPGGNKRYSFF